MRYRKKPVEIEAIKWNGANIEECKQFTHDKAEYIYHDAAYKAGVAPPSIEIIIHTLEGDMRVSVGDYIIKGVDGELYPCKPDIFQKTYEEVVEPIVTANDLLKASEHLATLGLLEEVMKEAACDKWEGEENNGYVLS